MRHSHWGVRMVPKRRRPMSCGPDDCQSSRRRMSELGHERRVGGVSDVSGVHPIAAYRCAARPERRVESRCDAVALG